MTHGLHALRVASLVDNVQVTLNSAFSFSEQTGGSLMFTRKSLARDKEFVKAIDYRGLVELNFFFIRVLGRPQIHQIVHLFIRENLGLVGAPDER